MPKKGCLGCSLPILIIVAVLFVALIVIGFLAGPIGKAIVGDVGLPDWVSPDKPHISLKTDFFFESQYYVISNTVIAAWLTIIVLLGISIAGTRKIKLVPRGIQNLLEFIVESLLNFCKSVAGDKNGRRFFPIVATIFLFVIFNAWLSLLPGFGSIIVHTHGHEVHLLRGANTDINMPLAIALASFIAVTFFGLRDAKWGFLAQFFNFKQFGHGVKDLFTGKVKSGLSGMLYGFIDAFVGGLELLSYFIRIISFTARLFGNMTAGEILLMVVAFMIPWVVSVIFYGLELLIGFVQALIFAGLTLVFLSMAVEHHGDESEHEAESEQP